MISNIYTPYKKYQINIGLRNCFTGYYPGLDISDGITFLVRFVFLMNEEYHNDFMYILENILRKAIDDVNLNINNIMNYDGGGLFMDDESILNFMAEGGEL